MAEYLRQNFLKIHFAKVAPIELSSGIHYEKAASIKPVRCPVQIFLAKKGYQMTSLQFLTTVPPTVSELNLKPREKELTTSTNGELAQYKMSDTRSVENISDLCSGDFNTSCVDEIKKELEKGRKKKHLKKMLEKVKYNAIHPE